MKQKIYHAGTQKELSKIASENNLDLNSKNKTDRQLSAIQNFSIGRSILYSPPHQNVICDYKKSKHLWKTTSEDAYKINAQFRRISEAKLRKVSLSLPNCSKKIACCLSQSKYFFA
jgi:hypothetical protein